MTPSGRSSAGSDNTHALQRVSTGHCEHTRNADAAGALAWCTSKNLDRDHCYAKIVSTTHPVHGSTAFNE